MALSSTLESLSVRILSIFLQCALVQFSVRENLLIVTGEPQTKQLKDLMPEIMKQVGPQQYDALKSLVGDFAKVSGAAGKAEDDEDDVPPLVAGTFEDAAGKK